ncbi:MAG TPA: DUF3426 domain-containing protein [Terriglobales bacterium]|nr:DUF3426 domain-containing protein [Terriglobales bacterium]
MATSPKQPQFPNIPPRRTGDAHGKVQIIKKSKFPWPIFILIVGAALIAGILYFLPRGPHVRNLPVGAQVPQQPVPGQVQLTNMKIEASPIGGALYLSGVLHNAGNTAINGVQVQAQFIGADGAPVATQTRPVEALLSGTNYQDLTQSPIQPDQYRPILIYFEHTPPAWNHQLPALTVTMVTGTKP